MARPYSPAVKYPAIDVLRAFAALLVVLYHVIVLSDWGRLPAATVPSILRNGWAGVDLFLAISGFVIALAALDGVERAGTGFRAEFARRRLARIVPLYLLTGAVFLVLLAPAWLATQWAALHVGSHLLFAHNLLHYTHGSINGPNWSVALEMQFYLLMLWLAPHLVRIGWARLLLASLLLAAAWRLGVAVLLADAPLIVRFIYLTELPGVIDQFALGIAFALILLHGPDTLRRWLAASWKNFAGWLALALVLFYLADRWQGPAAYLNSGVMMVAWRPLLSAGCTAMLAAAITFPAAEARVLAPLRYLGEISYGIYLWHMVVLLTLLRYAPQLQGVRLLACVLALTVLLAALSWHLMEKPFMNRMRRLPAARTPPPQPQQTSAVPP
jgi:peptidoglycan/LPS O-acetylase OafA/YrhL